MMCIALCVINTDVTYSVSTGRTRVLPIGDVQSWLLTPETDAQTYSNFEYYSWPYDLSTASVVSDEEYCQWETFRPRCLPGETVVISKAIYGRMSDTGRCLQDEVDLVALKDDPMYMGCSKDVLQLVSSRCFGRPGCEIRIPDPEMEKTTPCYRHMAKYLEVTYHCVKGMNFCMTQNY